ncbi:putative thioredoxin-disulfide reductase [Shuttleworthella sp. MSX8B]|uniref:NAD(P)/FAD-dependent oxidoreductase n=1 Tax=Shuttleworthella sp. MSX8B TaxID=936574 RepID=UPI00044B49F9|nr:FAD-dependent oxidoreductase [Shuttleworthia sp. MSX8B]EUB14581.1 putative thioredoxin-disulfide reductase [Shuttleworthia sp. MSX8B]
MYDILVVGAGTAGLSAGIYGVRQNKSVLILEANTFGGQIINTPDIENYPGIAHTSGFDFAMGLYQQAIDLGVEYRQARVASIEDAGDHKIAVLEDGDRIASRTIILATGAKNRPLGLAHEKEWIGRGISYCATCDGMFYRKKIVAVNGGGNTALEDAEFLSNIVEKVYVIHRRDQFRGEPVRVEKLRARENVEFVLNANITALLGQDRLEALEVTDKITGEKRIIKVNGLFVAIGQAPENMIFSNVVGLDKGGYIVAGEDCKTNVDGIFAAGDTRTKTVRQLTTAASDGAVAALAAVAYIHDNEMSA